MRDVLMDVYNALIANEVISSNCSGRIKFYDFPETSDTSKPFMIIAPLDVPTPELHGSNNNLGFEYLYQIDVQSSNRLIVKKVQEEARKEMKKLGFGQLSNGLDEYFTETKRYVDARRYSAFLFTE